MESPSRWSPRNASGTMSANSMSPSARRSRARASSVIETSMSRNSIPASCSAICREASYPARSMTAPETEPGPLPKSNSPNTSTKISGNTSAQKRDWRSRTIILRLATKSLDTAHQWAEALDTRYSRSACPVRLKKTSSSVAGRTSR